jgi:hypothetical protein
MSIKPIASFGLALVVLASLTLGGLPPAGAQTTPTPNEIFVRRVYLDFLDREPEPEELTDAATQLTSGSVTRTGFVRSIIRGDEFGEFWGIFSWAGYTDSAPTQQQLAAAMTESAAGRFITTEVAVLSSASYFTASGGTNQGFVTKIYADVLWRTASSADLTYWVGRLNSGTTRASLATTFLRTTEAAGKRVGGVGATSTCPAVILDGGSGITSGSYCLILDRIADASGLSYWRGRLAADGDLPEIWEGLAGSTEYFNLAQTTP